MAQSNRHPNFSGGAITEPRGYKLVFVGKGHHLADCRGYAYEHRLRAEKILKRKLKPREVVHHRKTGKSNRANNRRSNLRVFRTNGEHLSHHRRVLSDLRPWGASNPWVKCACGCGARFQKYDAHRRPRRYLTGHARKNRGKRYDKTRVQCACGCGRSFTKYDKWGRERRCWPSHNERKERLHRTSKVGH